MQLTQATVHELLLYDPFTGSLTWRARKRKWFNTNLTCKLWNARNAGQSAGHLNKHRGHRYVRIFGHSYLAHRIIWLWMTGRWPYPETDHRNRNKADNRWRNLREATRIENGRNLSISRRNKTGAVGVSQLPNGRYQARIKVEHESINLGCFILKDDAIKARRAANRRHGYSRGHGKKRPSRTARASTGAKR